MLKNRLAMLKNASAKKKDDAAKEAVYISYAKNLMSEENPTEFKRKLNFFYQQAKEVKSRPLQHFDDLLQDNFIVGEVHSSISSKKFLITNMKRLKDEGFTTLFMEHLLYDVHQKQLNDYFLSDAKDGKLEEQLLCYLQEQDSAFGTLNSCGPRYEETRYQWDNNNFTMLVKAAKEAGIRVVALDCKYEYNEQKKHQDYYGDMTDNYRPESMNFTAFQIITKEMENKNEKWFALMGNAHAKMYNNVIGVAELTGARSVYVSDNREDKKTTIDYNYPLHLKADHQSLDAIADVHIVNDFTQNTPTFSPQALALPRP